MITMNRENESERKDNPMSSTENPKLRERGRVNFWVSKNKIKEESTLEKESEELGLSPLGEWGSEKDTKKEKNNQ